MCELQAAHNETGGSRSRFAVRNSGLETSKANMGAFCRAKVRLGMVEKQTSHLECRTGKSAREKQSGQCRPAGPTFCRRFFARAWPCLRSGRPAVDSQS